MVNISLTLLHTCLAFLASGMMNVSTVTTAPWFPGRTRKPTTHHQWSRCPEIRGRCLCSPACPARLPDGVASAPSLAASARISQTLSAWPNHRSKWNVPKPVLIPTSSASSRTVTRRSCMTKVRTWSLSSSFRLAEGLPERASLSTDVRPSLSRLYHF